MCKCAQHVLTNATDQQFTNLLLLQLQSHYPQSNYHVRPQKPSSATTELLPVNLVVAEFNLVFHSPNIRKHKYPTLQLTRSHFVIFSGQPTYRAIGLGQRPYMDAPFASHLRGLEAEAYRRKGSSSQSSESSNQSYKVQSSNQIQGKHFNFTSN